MVALADNYAGLHKHPASFRDPSGFVFRDQAGVLHRQVNRLYEPHLRQFLSSGLYRHLVERELLIEHEDASLDKALTDEACQVIRPRELPFISYPYEWSFNELKDAALLTLEIQRSALERGMTLKDATAYNIQFEGAKPLFVDTLSFEPYVEGTPWIAYGQFCRHFVAPLALMARIDPRLGRLHSLYADGIPLDLASSMLPLRSYFRFGLLMHLHLQARLVRRGEARPQAAPPPQRRLSRASLVAIVDNLQRTISSLKWKAQGTEWADYYQNNSYTDESFECKKRLTAAFLNELKPRTVWDLGANAGVFSRLASSIAPHTYAFDIDPACVDNAYVACRSASSSRVLPLCFDMTNPTPGTGWSNTERQSFASRGPADVAMALALVHHMAIANNVPLDKVADFLAQISRNLIIEWVPKADVQVQRLLETRADIFKNYHRNDFESAFSRYFRIDRCEPIAASGRVLYRMKNRR